MVQRPARFLSNALLAAHHRITRYAARKNMADTPRTTALASTEVFDAQQRATDAEVDRIIASALGRKPPSVPVKSVAGNVTGPGTTRETAQP